MECRRTLIRDKLTNELASSALNQRISFKDIEAFPRDKGIYFIFYNDEVIYIGCSHLGEERGIKDRCRQHLQLGSGNNLLAKINKQYFMNRGNEDELIKFILDNLSVSFIILPNCTSRSIILNRKEYIQKYDPILNSF